MNTAAVQRPLPPPLTALWLWHELRFGLVFCLLISLVLTALWGKSLTVNLVYSYSIGLLTQAWIELGRYGLSALVRLREPGNTEARLDWPGWHILGPWILVSVALGYLGGSLIGDAVLGGKHTQMLLNSPVRAVVALLVVTLIAAVTATAYLYVQHRWATLSLARQSAERVAAETRLKLLESQLEPHMMFNTLANLRALIGTDPPRALAMLDHLNGYLRATLNASRAPLHPLSAEFDRSADYLALMQVRMGSRLSVTLDLPEALRDHPVPPLLLQPLVENAIRHGLEPHSQGGHITLSAALVDDTLTLCVQDSGVGLVDAASTGPAAGMGGVGLQLVLRTAGGGNTLARPGSPWRPLPPAEP